LSEAKRYNNYDIPPLKEDLLKVEEEFKTYVFLKAIYDGRIVGTIRAYEKEGICSVERLAVHPDMQNQGIGGSLMLEIENYFEPQRFELFVGAKSDKNIYLYKKMGYSISKKVPYGCGDIEILWMYKPGKGNK